LIKKKKEIFIELRNKGLGVQVHYIPVYFHPYYRDLGYSTICCEEAELFYNREISIPMYPLMENEQVEKVIEIILSVMKSFAQ
ncbi:MAG: DegT/DnrJ/EryC1/StrS family aminotransferase, partial [Candidatus Hodarchaeota archaeon]